VSGGAAVEHVDPAEYDQESQEEAFSPLPVNIEVGEPRVEA